ncbi:HET-domain-containing protein, partial [Patellaria atrata CBS 101060]
MVSVTSSSSASNNLDISCPTCHSLQPPTLIPQGTSPAVHFIPASELKTSSTSCDECRLIWDALGLYKHEWGEKEMELSVEVRMVSGGPLKVIWRNDILYLELFDRQGRFPTIGPVVEIPVHSSDEECYNTAAKWLENCVENHTLCKSTSSDPYLPTRVLDIGLDSSRDPFLFETNGQPGKYVALSYCWGKTKVLTTTTKNISSHKRSIPLDTLPKTLQDAVIISRRLGIPYLWVDALCIIQDDGDDWAYEASKMCDVYSLAHLTIAASNSPGSDKGIFSTQKYGIAPQPLRYQDRTIYVRPNLARQHDRSSALMQIPDAADPIVFRAWCLQEAVLANRILRYTSNELTWECNEQYACERPELSRVMSPSITAQHPYRKWNELIMVFTERHLTKDTDKLPALAGLARQFHMATEAITGTKDKYLAGL